MTAVLKTLASSSFAKFKAAGQSWKTQFKHVTIQACIENIRTKNTQITIAPSVDIFKGMNCNLDQYREMVDPCQVLRMINDNCTR